MPTYIGKTNEAFINGNSYPIMRRLMTGIIFKPGKDEHGVWIDKVGKPDTRIMLWKDVYGPHEQMGHKVYNSEEDILKDWDSTY